VSAVADRRLPDELRIGHPSGITPTKVHADGAQAPFTHVIGSGHLAVPS
jgi:hypothetical protein